MRRSFALRSPDSPEDFRIHLTLPTGAKAEKDPDTNAIVVRHGHDVLLSVSQPSATDAQGAKPTAPDQADDAVTGQSSVTDY